MRRQFKPIKNKPPDFDEFWLDTKRELEQLDPAVTREAQPSEKYPDLTLEKISFVSLGSVTVNGYLLSWKDDIARPLIICSHGYGVRCKIHWNWALHGACVFGVDIRGHGRSRDAVANLSPSGYVLTGIESPETSLLRGAVCDYMQAVCVARSLVVPTSARTVLQGASFAGALALMAEAVLGGIADLLVCAVPTLGWATGRHVFAKSGSGGEINRFLARRPDRFEDVMLVLRYFDPVNFADKVDCPTLLGVGLSDDAVPAETVFAVANHLGGPMEIMEFPFSHSGRVEEKLWDQFEERWLRLAMEGTLPDFGRADSQAN
ncbi:MAG: acetylxylan esterase [Gammaproteobacteria bacterium]|nr:acetylxylan esterase [Gammaproteobacteria bacterium]